ncbi:MULTISPECIES: tol-pal system-associated acyl-CoA thioesterase [unclassified Undibacterium]|uniref:tol-pal system-associated acyl-CoA thioesterase n=1 Tax=unclassified Undibacterium TaxID=2630295 RepID=UPI002AC8C40C|nr:MULTISPECIES: tol-pal system-associated acyl-CoA thioesterase [unclassified Undibacterium]MEB0137695.1 tol-pal system-associated acyl-CoA thioesterase [Undibacterium sp. CCC2.1]MEB0172653.1 tol-pal system-associated acyl-CoA thioesterase [Undibacterium sp. CCC1.1]MEB0177586.1 tol-pal system-associated acyl-CoA thioesterase [Undibacterium sp. CCC3.4]MEB0215448.1 tol-pal system-associated acyl-CoA thioesterase [Undibacterium sp. 5I2]WPX42269.1 tol-pal system-associated acyl-CoA thioesterase [
MRKFDWQLRVYYEDTDVGGIVYYANYLKFFERARTECLRATGVNQQQLLSDEGRMFVVKDCAVAYHAPARLDDALRVSVELKKLGRASLEFFQQVWCAERLLASGTIMVACVDAHSLRPAAIPVSVLEKISL